jgi:hypothetical protein
MKLLAPVGIGAMIFASAAMAQGVPKPCGGGCDMTVEPVETVRSIVVAQAKPPCSGGCDVTIDPEETVKAPPVAQAKPPCSGSCDVAPQPADESEPKKSVEPVVLARCSSCD